MIPVFEEILEKTIARLSHNLTTYLPPLIVAIFILLVTFAVAKLVRWVILRAVKAITLDKFLRDSGLTSIFDRSGQVRAATLVAGIAYWAIVATGLLTALDTFDTSLTSQMVQATVFSIPKLVTAGLILLAGFWLAQYLGRSALLWAVNEGMPFARRIAMGVRVVIVFVAVVVAADALNFARSVFFAAFVILVGGATFALSLALGVGLRPSIERRLREREPERVPEPERSVWSHL